MLRGDSDAELRPAAFRRPRRRRRAEIPCRASREALEKRRSARTVKDQSLTMNERQQSHIDFYLRRLEHWTQHKPASSTARLLAARDADEAHPLRNEVECAEVVEYLWRQEQAAS